MLDVTFGIDAQQQQRIASLLEYRINKFQIPTEERHNLQLDASFIPTPSINQSGSISFALPPHYQIL